MKKIFTIIEDMNFYTFCISIYNDHSIVENKHFIKILIECCCFDLTFSLAKK